MEGAACAGYTEAFAQDVEGSAALFFWGCEFGDEPVEQTVFLGLSRGGVCAGFDEGGVVFGVADL